jgi:competence protein ComEC
MAILLEVLLIWSFAALTGLGPSVQRAAFMFSLLAISKWSDVKSNTVNLTAASAVLLLILQPGHLFEAGFQLSYAAVFGILLFYPKIYGLFHTRNRILNYLWSLEAVSFSAVIGTAPISIYYFQQFPLFFPVANLVAVPAAFIIVALTVFLLALNRFSFAAWVLSWLLSKSAGILMTFSLAVGNIKYAALNMLYIDQAELILITWLLLLALALIYDVGTKRSLMASILIGMLVLFCYTGISQSVEYSRPEFYPASDSRDAIYNVGKRQYVFYDENRVSPYRNQISGNHKFDAIRQVDSLVLSEEVLSNLLTTVAP